MSYNAGKVSKLMDMLEGTATEWMENQVTDYYSVDDVSELTEDQISEISEYREDDFCEPFVAVALGNLINYWESSNDEYQEEWDSI